MVCCSVAECFTCVPSVSIVEVQVPHSRMCYNITFPELWPEVSVGCSSHIWFLRLCITPRQLATSTKKNASWSQLITQFRSFLIKCSFLRVSERLWNVVALESLLYATFFSRQINALFLVNHQQSWIPSSF